MANYTQSRVLSLRIDSALVEAVRARAKSEGRSVSGQIVWCVREQVESATQAPAAPLPISGWLSHRAVPATHEEFRKGRAQASKNVRAAIRKKARAK